MELADLKRPLADADASFPKYSKRSIPKTKKKIPPPAPVQANRRVIPTHNPLRRTGATGSNVNMLLQSRVS